MIIAIISTMKINKVLCINLAPGLRVTAVWSASRGVYLQLEGMGDKRVLLLSGTSVIFAFLSLSLLVLSFSTCNLDSLGAVARICIRILPFLRCIKRFTWVKFCWGTGAVRCNAEACYNQYYHEYTVNCIHCVRKKVLYHKILFLFVLKLVLFF